MARLACSTSTMGRAEMATLRATGAAARASRPVSRRWLLRALTGAGAALGMAGVCGGPGGSSAWGGSAWASPVACAFPPREPHPFASPDPAVSWSAPPGPTFTSVNGGSGQFVYTVGGSPEIIRGMGYNPPISAGLTVAARRLRLEQDLQLMAAAHVNTLIGWNPAAIDGLTLDVAWQAGLGVTLPFDVDFTAGIRDASIRRAFTDAVLAWVEQYRAHPAVRM